MGLAAYVQPVIQQYKSFCINQSSHYENYGQFPLRMEAIMFLPQIDTFRCDQR